MMVSHGILSPGKWCSYTFCSFGVSSRFHAVQQWFSNFWSLDPFIHLHMMEDTKELLIFIISEVKTKKIWKYLLIDLRITIIKQLHVNINNTLLKITVFYKAKKFSDKMVFLPFLFFWKSLMVCLRKGIQTLRWCPTCPQITCGKPVLRQPAPILCFLWVTNSTANNSTQFVQPTQSPVAQEKHLVASHKLTPTSFSNS